MAQVSKASVRAIASALALSAALALPPAGLMAQEGGGGQPPAAVTVETLHPQSLTLTSTLPGRVRAVAEAEVRPQVNGIILERNFKEGSMVEEGDVLYQIDPTTYEAALAQAEASLTSAQAQLRAAERDFERVQELADRGINSQQAMDDATSARDIAQAQVKMAEAALRTAQIELDHTQIRARLSGLAGLSEVSQGALVTASQSTPLTTIRQLDTVHVDVTQSAAELLAWRRGAADIGDGAEAEVSLTLADGSEFPHTGLLTAAEPHVDEQTGVVVLRIEFPNDEMMLLPGMYVQVEMPTNAMDNVYLVPQEAVTRDRRGNPQTLVVTADNTVEQRSLTVLQDRGSDWVVTEGVNDGDRVIVAGLQSASPGATVSPQERAADGEDASE
ncbi:efflux RND transporter periplasmic adaptor subunit [Pseudooceanicola marinus]|uniref:efflux RND transporter periplasmic adaptor subunit n=1 Tax=Pseudooceanicola marinus TaxID=396013 RepID=UPI001CD2CBAD|nr:efflux RND transporter periplasmic adaptor subunit [Pseudooceanicola marinus]MCA1334621.1 efflux RND transporter periplasmic adaptor subunit [Pseudooceanicola marinus]